MRTLKLKLPFIPHGDMHSRNSRSQSFIIREVTMVLIRIISIQHSCLTYLNTNTNNITFHTFKRLSSQFLVYSIFNFHALKCSTYIHFECGTFFRTHLYYGAISVKCAFKKRWHRIYHHPMYNE